MQRQILDLLNDQKVLGSKIKLVQIPSSYADILDAALHNEFASEINKLLELFSIEEINEYELRNKFKILCAQRETQNQNTYLSYLSIPEGTCNRLYYDIAMVLFNPQNFFELIQILMPGLQQHVVIAAGDFLNPKTSNTQKMAEQLDVKLVCQSLEKLSVYPAQLSKFTEMVIDANHHLVFMLNDIEAYPLYAHLILNRLLDSYPKLKEKIYNHNDDFKQLSFHIELIGNKAVTPNEMLTRFATQLMHTGSRYTGKVYATPSAVLACQNFQAYLDQLPPDFRKALLALQEINSEKTLEYVIEEHLGKGLCVEQAVIYIKSIQQNAKNHAVLNQIPHSSPAELTAIKRRYRKPIQITGFDDSKALPSHYLKSLLKNIKITSVADYIDLLINIPCEEYLNLIKYAEISCNPVLPDELGNAISMFSLEQQNSFMTAIVNQINKFGLHEILTFSVQFKFKSLFTETLKQIPKEQHKNSLVYNVNPSILVNSIIHNNIEVFNYCWNILSDNEKTIMICNMRFNESSFIQYIAEVGQVDILVSVLNHLSDTEKAKFLTEGDFVHGQSALYFSISNPDSKVFTYIWKYFYKKKDKISLEEFNSHIFSLLEKALKKNNLFIFNKIYNLLAPNDQLLFLYSKKEDDYLIEPIFYFASIEIALSLWGLYSKSLNSQSVLDQVKIKLFFLKKAINLRNSELFNLIWDASAPGERALFWNWKNSSNQGLLQLAITEKNYIFFKNIWDLFIQYNESNADIPFRLTDNYRGFLQTAASVDNIKIFQTIFNRLSDREVLFHLHNNTINVNQNFFHNLLMHSSMSPECESIVTKILQLIFTTPTKYPNITAMMLEIVNHGTPANVKLAWNFLSLHEQKELINEKFINGRQLIHAALANIHSEIWDFLWPYYKENHLTLINNHDFTNLAILRANAHALKVILDEIKLNKLEKLLLAPKNPKSLLLIAVTSSHAEIFSMIWECIPNHQRFLIFDFETDPVSPIFKDVISNFYFRENFLENCWKEYCLTEKEKVADLLKSDGFIALLKFAIKTNEKTFNIFWNNLTVDYQIKLIQSHSKPNNNLLIYVVQNNCINIAKSILKIFTHQDDLLNLLLRIDEQGETVFHLAASLPNPAMFKILWNLLLPEQKLQVLKIKDNDGRLLLHLSKKMHIDTLKLIMDDISKLSTEAQVSFVTASDTDGVTPLFFAIQNTNPNVFITLWNHFPSTVQSLFLTLKSNIGSGLLHFAAQFSAPLTWVMIWNLYSEAEKLEIIFAKSGTSSRSPFFWSLESNLSAFHTMLQFMLDHKSDNEFLLHMTNHEDTTPLQICVNSNSNFFPSIWNVLSDISRVKAILKKNKSGLNLLEQGSKHYSNTALLNFYASHANIDYLFLCSVIYSNFIELTKKSIQKIAPENRLSTYFPKDKSKNNLFQLVTNKHYNWFRVLFDSLTQNEQLSVIKWQDKLGHNLLHYAANCNNRELVILILNFIVAAAKVDLLPYLKTKNYQGISVFHIAAKMKDPAIWDTLMKYLLNDALKAEVALDKSISGSTPLHVAAENSNPQVLKCVLNVIPKKQRLNAIFIKNRFSNAPIHRAAKNKSADVFEMLLNMLSNNEERHLALAGNAVQSNHYLDFTNSALPHVTTETVSVVANRLKQ